MVGTVFHIDLAFLTHTLEKLNKYEVLPLFCHSLKERRGGDFVRNPKIQLHLMSPH